MKKCSYQLDALFLKVKILHTELRRDPNHAIDKYGYCTSTYGRAGRGRVESEWYASVCTRSCSRHIAASRLLSLEGK
jgi:hypothetical protein